MAILVAILLALFVLPSPWGAVAVVIGVAWEAAEAVFMIRWSQRRRARTGAEALLGQVGRVVVACAPKGQVTLHGERWQAACAEHAAVGDDVVVRGLDGLVLRVERVSS